MENKPKQIRAVELVRDLFEYIHGNLGLLRFSIEELKPNNGHGTESDKWVVVCSFYKTLSSQQPTVYKTEVDLTSGTVTIEQIKGEDKTPEPKKVYRIQEEK
jgi:hypothetical protein